MKQLILFSILAFAFSAMAAPATEKVNCTDFNGAIRIQVTVNDSGEGSGVLQDNFNTSSLVCHQSESSHIACVGFWAQAFDSAGNEIDKTVSIDIEKSPSSMTPPAVAKYLRDWDARDQQQAVLQTVTCDITQK